MREKSGKHNFHQYKPNDSNRLYVQQHYEKSEFPNRIKAREKREIERRGKHEESNYFHWRGPVILLSNPLGKFNRIR